MLPLPRDERGEGLQATMAGASLPPVLFERGYDPRGLRGATAAVR
jgi:hypothetical protein